MIPRLLIDTNAYTALLSGNTDVADIIAESEVVLVSPIVVGELLDGFRGGTRERENRDILSRFCGKSRTVAIPVTEATAEWFAEVKQQLRKKGTPIPINDVWIASSALEHGAVLLTLDRHFENVEGLLKRIPETTRDEQDSRGGTPKYT
jgi:tRNA(fMet)-specific endonuclease VapC